jgi:hypothetical protein
MDGRKSLNAMALPPALANGLPVVFPNAESGPAGRFRSAWDAFQFAAARLIDAKRLLFLAELAGDDGAFQRYAAEVRFLEKANAAAEREWRASGPGQ